MANYEQSPASEPDEEETVPELTPSEQSELDLRNALQASGLGLPIDVERIAELEGRTDKPE